MQLKIVLNDKRKSLAPTTLSSPTSCLYEITDADTALVSELQKHCASEFKIPVESVRLVHWKGYSICSGSRIKFKTLSEAGLEDRDRLTLVRLPPVISSPIAPTVENLCGPPVRLQRRSLQIDDGKVCLVTEERFYEKPSIPASVQPIYKSSGGSILLKRNETPQDQNCLYRCISQLLFQGEQSTVAIRWLCTNALTKRPEIFTPDILRTTVQDYAKKILNTSSYGGYIELSLIALEYNVGLAAWHTRNQRLDVYGEDFERSKGRHYLIYDGVHYDWVSGIDPVTNREYRLFSADDQTVLNQVKQLASRINTLTQGNTQQIQPSRQVVSGVATVPTQMATMGHSTVTTRHVTTSKPTSTHAVTGGKQIISSRPTSPIQTAATTQHTVSGRSTTPIRQSVVSTPIASTRPSSSARPAATPQTSLLQQPGPSVGATSHVVTTRPTSPALKPSTTADPIVSTRHTFPTQPPSAASSTLSAQIQQTSIPSKGGTATQQAAVDRRAPQQITPAPLPIQTGAAPSPTSLTSQKTLRPTTYQTPSSQSAVPMSRRLVAASPKASVAGARPIDTPEKSRLTTLGRTTPIASSKKSLPLPTSQ